MIIFRLVIVLFLVLILSPSEATEQPEKIENTVGRSVEVREKTQHAAKRWHSEMARLKSRYFQLKEELEETRLESYRMKALVDRQEAYLSRIHKKMIEMEKIRQNLIPYLEQLLARMEKDINSDLPFLTEERTARLKNLKVVLYDPEITLGQKFRRVFEGLRVEMEYGKSVEVSKKEINYNGERLLVKMLRIGRTALIVQTLDEKECAIYSGREWKALPDDYREQIKKAIAIAERKRPVEFVNLPVKAIQQ